MSIFSPIIDPLKALFTKSWGEAQFSRLMGSTGNGAWSYGGGGTARGRQELANHYTGFNYLAIQPLMKEIGGMTPHAGYRRDGINVREAQNKALAAGNWDEYKQIRSKFLNPYERSKAIAPVQTHEELEPISTNHELIRLLRNPNGPDTSTTFFRKLVMFWRLYGEFYIWLVPPRIERMSGKKHPPVEMWVLPSHWVWPIHDPEKDRIFSAFEVRPYASYYPVESAGSVAFGWYPGAGSKTIIPADQIVYYGEPNPTGFMNGYSPLTACSHWIDCSDSIDRSRTAQFQNGAFPGVVLEFDKGVAEPDQATINRLEARIVGAYAGVRKSGRTMILSPGVKMRPLDNKPYEMGYTESADQIKDWIFAAQGTGQSIVGLVEQTTFNNVWGARANFYSNTIKPMVQLLGEVFTEKIARRFDPDLVCYWPDTSPVDPDLQLRELDTMLKDNVLTINEVCSIKGYAPKPWGDKPLDALKAEWMAAGQPQQPGVPGAPTETPGQATPPDGKELEQSPLRNGKKPPNHPEDKVNALAEHMTNMRIGPSKNGAHRAALGQHRLR